MSASLSPNRPLARRFASLIQASRTWQCLLFVLVCAVCYLAVTPTPPKEADLGWDKLNHTLAFASLAVAGGLAFPGSRWQLVRVLLGLLALGALIEIVQYFVPGRSCEWSDLLADGVGIAIGLSAVVPLRRLTTGRR